MSNPQEELKFLEFIAEKKIIKAQSTSYEAAVDMAIGMNVIEKAPIDLATVYSERVFFGEYLPKKEGMLMVNFDKHNKNRIQLLIWDGFTNTKYPGEWFDINKLNESTQRIIMELHEDYKEEEL